MLHGLTGSLLSHYFVEHLLTAHFGGQLGEDSMPAAQKQFLTWWRAEGAHLGPASSLRTIRDRAGTSLTTMLGFVSMDHGAIASDVMLVFGHWNDDLDSLWRHAVRTTILANMHWCVCTNGRMLRLVDAHRTYSRAYLQFELERVAHDPNLFAVFWALLRAEAFRKPPDGLPLIVKVIQTSARHGLAVSKSLRFGVIDAVGLLLAGLLESTRGRHHHRPTDAQLRGGFEESLTVVYRALFLMFAEARGLVPNWHPLYRDRYTIESLRDEAERPGKAGGIWETLQAIARLAHHGCHAGSLIVPAFNGRLFAPTRSPVAESCDMDDEIARQALLAISTSPARKQGRVRIDYRDLGVEQLGAVYESVLDYQPSAGPSSTSAGVCLKRGGTERKATGSFYTPQSITDYLVRRTLHPLVQSASAEQILALRVLDPAMGSGAFLVAACRYLAIACEAALIRDGEAQEDDITEPDRAGFRRQIAQRCLYGVDINPTAVQLARLSLWLTTLSAGKPLTFLDHHLAVGDSLIGASLIDLARQPPALNRRKSAGSGEMPLFTPSDLEPSLAHVLSERRWLADTSDDRADVVREKEQRLERLASQDRWTRLADLWCACWMWPDRASAPEPAVFAALSDHIIHGRSPLAATISERLLHQTAKIAHMRRFFHWMLEFPEAFFDSGGQAARTPGFDAVVGNPPWDMLRADGGDDQRATASDNVLMRHFVRDSGVYRHQGPGHVNRYQLFVERALSVARTGGRLGLVLPSGIATDHTSSELRRWMLTHHRIDSIVGFDNRHAIFPIHRSVRFVLLTATAGSTTEQINCRFGNDDPVRLDTIPDEGYSPDAYPIALTPALITRIAGGHMTIPELRTPLDLAIVERIVHRFPRLGTAEGWGAKFGRELNATDDSRYFHRGRTGLPVLEGKHIEPFKVHVERAENRIHEKTAARLLRVAELFRHPRLAYRDVASSTNRLSLIAAILPAGVLSTHSLFCLKTFLTGPEQLYLCAMLNSYVANYLVRQVMTNHLGSTTIEELRVPKLLKHSPTFRDIVERTHRLRLHWNGSDGASLQARAAKAYELSLDEFRHVVATFPLIPEPERTAALEEFSRL